MPRDSALLRPSGWSAELSLVFDRRGERTVLAKAGRRGPLTVQRPFYPEGSACHMYLLHPPAGVVGGDSLELGVRAAPGAHAVLTTPAATKFYRCESLWAWQRAHVSVEPDACVEWLPQESIFHDGTQARVETIVDVASGARFIGWDIVCLGRPAAAERFSTGDALNAWRIRKDGRAVLNEVQTLRPESIAAIWGMRGRGALLTFHAYPVDCIVLEAVRDAVGESSEFGATLIDDWLVCRGLADYAYQLQRTAMAIWSTVRPLLLGRPACVPRIWAT